MKKAATALLSAITISLVMTGCSVGKSETIEQKAAVDNAKTLEVEVSNADINIYPGKSDKIEAHLYGTASRADDYQLEASRNGDGAIVRVHHNSGIVLNFGNDSLRLDITVPEAEFAKWNIRASSADVTLSSPKVRDLNVTTSSGSFDLTGYQGDNLSVETSSGDVEMRDISAKDAKVTTSSGDVELSGFAGDQINIDSSSGDLKATAVSGAARAHTSSGSVRLDMKELTKSIQAESNSGDVTIGIPSGANFEFDGKTSSGKLSVDFPTNFQKNDKKHKLGTVGTGGPKLSVSTSSGDVQIERR